MLLYYADERVEILVEDDDPVGGDDEIAEEVDTMVV